MYVCTYVDLAPSHYPVDRFSWETVCGNICNVNFNKEHSRELQHLFTQILQYACT